MSFLREIAPTIDNALDLAVPELAWALLREMQTKGKSDHAGNWSGDLARTYDPPLHERQPLPRRGEEFALAVAEALGWMHANGLVATFYDGNYLKLFVTRIGAKLDTEEMFKRFLRKAHLNPSALHPIVREEAWSLYARGKSGLAVFEAFKRVEIAVRSAGNFGAADLGPALMRLAFNENTGPLTDMSLLPQERQSISALFAGSIGAFKNPGSHREVEFDDPLHAAELLMLASNLLRIVDDSVTRNKNAQKAA